MTKFLRQGGADWAPFSIAQDDKRYITENISYMSSVQVSSEKWAAFFSSIEFEISMYLAHQGLSEVSSPAITRANLKELKSIVEKLDQALHELDANSVELIRENAGGSVSEIKAQQKQFYYSVCHAMSAAEQYPQKGRLYDPSRPHLALKIIGCLYELTGINPSTTKEGLYDSCLGIILEIATGNEVKSSYKLLCDAVKQFKAEYTPN